MRSDHYRHLHANATVDFSSLAAANCSRSSPSTCSSAQQAAAAWAWFEHGGSSCITPSKSEGLVAAKGGRRRFSGLNVGAGRPSRFKMEALNSRKILQQKSAVDGHVVIAKPGRARLRRHSFDHNTDLTDINIQRFSSSCRITSPCCHFDSGSSIDDQDEARNEESRNTDSCQNQDCSLLDKFEVEAVCRQLDEGLSPSCRSPWSSAEQHEYPKSQKSHHDHPQEHVKATPRQIKSCRTAAHKPSAESDHHHRINDAVNRLLHSHIKVSSRHSTIAAPVPFLCSSIATANSIVDHHHRRSPKRSKAEIPINRTAKWRGVLHKWGIRENEGKVSHCNGEVKLEQVSSIADKVSAAAYEHERGGFTLEHLHKLQQQKLDVLHRDQELFEEDTPEIPSMLQPSVDSKFTKALLPLVSHLPRFSTLAPGHHKHADKSWSDDRVLVLAQSNRILQWRGEHVHHIHHHHHHHYHHLQQTEEAFTQDARRQLRDFSLEGHTGAHELDQALKFADKEKHMISGAADRGEGRP